MGIKSNLFINFFLSFLILFLFLGIANHICISEEQQAEIIFVGEPTYTLKNELKNNNVIVGRSYVINIVLQNIGNNKSEKLVVKISDEEGFSLTNHTQLYPGVTKTISFNWATLLNRDQQITVNFFPSDLDKIWTRYNSGKKTFTIKINDAEDGLTATNTPGFEIIIVFCAVIMNVILFRKKHSKNNF
jgi:hypothetical protein